MKEIFKTIKGYCGLFDTMKIASEKYQGALYDLELLTQEGQTNA